ncbi:DnaJ-like protein [Microbotryomycetes sp. JL221]|nr:DnaJ-like protein [Microbotryomycetes sp. JL221]
MAPSTGSHRPPLVQTRKRDPSTVIVTCVYCQTQLEYTRPGSTSSNDTATSPSSSAGNNDEVELECAQCHKHWTTNEARSNTATSTGGTTTTNSNANGSTKSSTTSKAKRRIGTDEKPLDMSYYDLLGLPANCTTEDVKKAYRRLAIKNHPDKNPDDPQAAERFKEIAVAYTTLSDEGLRHTYNEFGKGKGDGTGADGIVDPESIFSQLFGGERFQDIIGTLSLGQEMKSAMQEEQDDDEEEGEAGQGKDSTVTKAANNKVGPDGKPVQKSAEELEAERKKKEAKEAVEKKQAEQKAQARQERVQKLANKLMDKLALFTEQAQDEEDQQIASGVRTMWSIEAEELKQESYGVELLHTVGFVYTSKSKHYLASTGIVPFGMAGWVHSMKSAAHIVGQTVSTVRSAYALKDVFDALAAAEKSGLSEEKKKELEDKAAQMGLHALFKGAKLEVESVIREVCDLILSDASVPVLRKRAIALGLLGESYENVKKDENCNPPLGAGPFGMPTGSAPSAAAGGAGKTGP